MQKVLCCYKVTNICYLEIYLHTFEMLDKKTSEYFCDVPITAKAKSPKIELFSWQHSTATMYILVLGLFHQLLHTQTRKHARKKNN